MQGKNICVTHQKRFQVAKLNKVDHTTEHNANLLIYWPIYVPTPTYGYELWVLTKRMRSQMQTVEMSFM